MLAYFLYVTVLAQFRPVDPLTKTSVILLNLFIGAVFFLLARTVRSGRLTLALIIRDWLPAPLIILAYREMGWMALLRTVFDTEAGWVEWDRLLLAGWGLKAAIEVLGPVLPSILEVSYSLVYATTPFAMAMVYRRDRRARMEDLIFPILLTVLGTYALFPYFPSEPPRTVFPGELFPVWPTVFRRFNWWLLEGYGIHMSVFPSAHVSGAFASAFAARAAIPEARWISRLLLAMAVLIATATVYCRYHYAVDALAGFALAVLVAAVLRLGGYNGFTRARSSAG